MFEISLSVVILLQITTISSLNILTISPPSSRSHFKAFQPLFVGLAEKGHNVTVFTAYLTQEKIPHYTEIDLGDFGNFSNRTDKNPVSIVGGGDMSRKKMYWIIPILFFYGSITCRILFEEKPVQEFLKNNNTFDIVITSHFNSDCALVIAKKYNCPIIRVAAGSYFPWSHGTFGLPLNPSYMPNIFLPFTDEMTFWTRLENTILTAVVTFWYHHYVIQKENDLVAEYFGDSAKTLHEDIYKNSLLLVNRHFIYPYPMPTVPNVIEVGGINVGKSKILKPVSSSFIYKYQHVKIQLIPDIFQTAAH